MWIVGAAAVGWGIALAAVFSLPVFGATLIALGIMNWVLADL